MSSSCSYFHALENEIREIREVIGSTKTSIVANVISTKQNARKLEFMAKNKNASKEAVEMVDTRKKHEQLEFKYKEALVASSNMVATLQEQTEQKAFLHKKIEKWSQRCELYDKPFQEKAHLLSLKEKVKQIKEALSKDEVNYRKLGKSSSSDGELEERL